MISNGTVGLWMLPAHVGTSRGALAALQRDFARLRTLDHPHIARLLELGCNGQQYYVTGERLDGETLRDVLTHLGSERLEVGEADDVIRAIGSALVYAHEHEVVHGDVRAENVLVTMDRRFMLTNFLARRVAKVAARPPRPVDDLTGLARLAAELYTGSTSPHALRTAAHSGIPAARLNALRGVLAPPSRRLGSVAEFLAAAGLAASSGAAATSRVGAMQRPSPPPRTWSLRRLVLPVAAVVVIGAGIASYRAAGPEWRDSAAELQRRGLEVLRTVATRATPPASAPAPAEPTESAPARPTGAQSEASAASASSAASAPPSSTSETVVEPAAPDLAPAAEPATAPPPTPAPVKVVPVATTAAVPRDHRAVLSMGVPRVAAREDHSVVAIDIVRSGDITHETAVGWWTAPDTAHPDDDYATGGRQTVTFPAGATVKRVLIPIVNDGKRESDEVFTVHLGAPRNAVTGDVAATRVTLLDDD